MSDTSNSSSASSNSSASAGGVVVGSPTATTAPKSSSSLNMANATVAPKMQTDSYKDTCTWYAGSQCYMPRNCYDCINVALPKTKCAVDPHGMCVPMSTYDLYMSMQSNASDADLGFSGYFPSDNYTYCSATDATCNSCKTAWREQYWSTGQAPAPAMCRGDGGCICISSCELPNRVESIITSLCSVFGFDSSRLTTVIYVGVAMIGMVIVAAVTFATFAKRRAKRERERVQQARAERRQRRREAHLSRMRTGPPLALNGWNSLRDKLLESEREFLEGGKPSLAEPGVGKAGDEHTVGGGGEENAEFSSFSSSSEDESDFENESRSRRRD